MSNTKIIIVDKDDKIIGHKERGTLNPLDIYRVSGLWIQNSSGDILLAQRSFNKKKHPGKWGPAVAGTIDEGETYESNIIKEAEEEIGLTNYQFEKSFYDFNDGKYKHFTQWFFTKVDENLEFFKIQKEEVEQIKWFTKDELLNELKNNPQNFINSVSKCIQFFNK